jgi:hypothetical protein
MITLLPVDFIDTIRNRAAEDSGRQFQLEAKIKRNSVLCAKPFLPAPNLIEASAAYGSLQKRAALSPSLGDAGICSVGVQILVSAQRKECHGGI